MSTLPERIKNQKFDIENYESLERFSSYYSQLKSVSQLKPRKILEIGVGSKLFSTYLKNAGYDVKTLDYNEKLEPDLVGDIRDLPVKNNSFDVVAAFEVLEHLPFEEQVKILQEMKRVTKKNIIISVPSTSLNIFAYFRLFPGMKPRYFFLKLCDAFFYRHRFSGIPGSHHWVLGRKGTTRKDFGRKIRQAGLKIVDEFHPKLNPGHYFYVLQK